MRSISFRAVKYTRIARVVAQLHRAFRFTPLNIVHTCSRVRKIIMLWCVVPPARATFLLLNDFTPVKNLRTYTCIHILSYI